MSKPHHFVPLVRRCSAWRFCVGCGLLWLKNAASDRAARAACPGKDD